MVSPHLSHSTRSTYGPFTINVVPLLTCPGQEVNVEVPVSHLKVFGGTAFQMLSAGLHGCTQVSPIE